MTDKPTMKALIYASYRCYRDYALKAAAVALVPALLNVVLIQTAGQFDALAEGARSGCSLACICCRSCSSRR